MWGALRGHHRGPSGTYVFLRLSASGNWGRLKGRKMECGVHQLTEQLCKVLPSSSWEEYQLLYPPLPNHRCPLYPCCSSCVAVETVPTGCGWETDVLSCVLRHWTPVGLLQQLYKRSRRERNINEASQEHVNRLTRWWLSIHFWTSCSMAGGKPCMRLGRIT